jgi:hypothetical protein
MKNNYSKTANILVLIVTLSTFVFTCCKKDDPATIPILSTASVFDLTETTAKSGGNVTHDGGASITSRGVCWSNNANPSTSDSKTIDGSGTGEYTSIITGLTPGVTYHVRAYALNSIGTSYGGDIAFTTIGEEPENITLPATNIFSTGATLNGAVNARSISTTVTFEYGTTTAYGSSVAALQSPVTGTSLTNVSANISGLQTGVNYHFRVKTVNSLGTVYGGDFVFLTSSIIASTPFIVFENGNDIYSCNIDGTNIIQLTTGSSIETGPRINYSKTKIAFFSNRTGRWEIFLMNIDGTGVQQLTTTGVSGGQNNGNTGGLDWTPDGKLLFGNANKIYIMNSDGSNITQVATAPSNYWVTIRCSPNGDKIMAQTQGSWGYTTPIYMMNFDGSNIITFVSDIAGAEITGCFSKDGLSFLYSYDISGHEEVSGQCWNEHIISKGIDGSGNTDLSLNKPNQTNDYNPEYSPDGTKILFINNVVSPSATNLWIMNTDGSNRIKLISSTNVYSFDCK